MKTDVLLVRVTVNLMFPSKSDVKGEKNLLIAMPDLEMETGKEACYIFVKHRQLHVKTRDRDYDGSNKQTWATSHPERSAERVWWHQNDPLVYVV